MPDPYMVVLDTTVLSNFALIEGLALLERLYGHRACTALAVVEEIRRGLAAGYSVLQHVERAFAPPVNAGWLKITPLTASPEQARYLELLDTLGPGEAACLALAERHRLVLASDDLAARHAATQIGVRLTGTIGILTRLVREGVLSLAEGNAHLRYMLASGYRSPVEMLDEFL